MLGAESKVSNRAVLLVILAFFSGLGVYFSKPKVLFAAPLEKVYCTDCYCGLYDGLTHDVGCYDGRCQDHCDCCCDC